MDNAKVIQLNEKLQDPKFRSRFIGVSIDEAINILHGSGLDLSKEELSEIERMINLNSDTELNEEDLEAVAGGGPSVKDYWNALKKGMSWDDYWRGLKVTFKGFFDGVGSVLKK